MAAAVAVEEMTDLFYRTNMVAIPRMLLLIWSHEKIEKTKLTLSTFSLASSFFFFSASDQSNHTFRYGGGSSW